MSLFGVVRCILAMVGVLAVLQAVYAVPYTIGAGEWLQVFLEVISAILGVWLVRVGLNGTFSGEPEELPVAELRRVSRLARASARRGDLMEAEGTAARAARSEGPLATTLDA